MDQGHNGGPSGGPIRHRSKAALAWSRKHEGTERGGKDAKGGKGGAANRLQKLTSKMKGKGGGKGGGKKGKK